LPLAAQQTLAGSTQQAKQNRPAFDITKADISSIRQAIKTKQITCETLTGLYIDRIKQYNLDTSRGAAINAWVNLSPSLLIEAKQLDKHFATSKQLLGPLHCVPIIVKDNIDTYDSTSSSGSLALLGSQPNKDAFLVTQLRQAGGIILGKGAMDEFASGMSGISSKSGRTGNAYDPRQNPGGSSAGPAAAVSANFAVVGIGTDNSGSVRVPAAFNGIYGLRPSSGLISRSGIFPRGNLDGIAGPLTRSVKDMAIVLSVITKPDAKDPQTLNHPVVHSYEKQLNKADLAGMKFGVVKSAANISLFKATPESINQLYKAFFSRLKDKGASLVDISLTDFNADRKNNTAGEIQQINNYLASFPSTRQNFSDICQSNRTQTFGDVTSCLDYIKQNPPLEGTIYRDVLKLFTKNRRYVQKVMADQQLDALIVPVTSQGKATYDISSIHTYKPAISSNSGLPAIVVNLGFTNDKVRMPVSMEIIGKLYDETGLLQIAYILEKTDQPGQPNLGSATTPAYINDLTIPQYNNLLALIGSQTYQQFLKTNPANKLTPGIATKILTNTINSYQNPDQE
jgi:aspartyl-tRNA(Asn)/glutamyl-tRNA(Gln) amidotransferase subunit A